jgi:5-methylcytosine-specific restriction protein A
MVLAAEPLCRHCSRPGLDVDHIIPLASGGTNDRNNLQVLCHSCHSSKTAGDQLRKCLEAL